MFEPTTTENVKPKKEMKKKGGVGNGFKFDHTHHEPTIGRSSCSHLPRQKEDNLCCVGMMLKLILIFNTCILCVLFLWRKRWIDIL